MRIFLPPQIDFPSCAARDLMVAADRMRDQWAEGDERTKARLWIDLHTSADNLREALDVQ